MQSLRARCTFTSATFGIAYRAYNNYAHATRLIDSFFFFSPYFSRRHRHRRRRGPFTGPADRITRHLEYLFVHSIRLCTDGVCARICVERETRFSREKQHRRTERDRPIERKERRAIFSFSFHLPPSFSLSYVRVSLTRRALCRGRGTRCERREFPVVNVFGCICLSLLSPSHARAREHLLRRHG